MLSKLTLLLLICNSAQAGWLDFFNAPQNQVVAGPSSGGTGTARFRSLVGADLPNPSATTLGGTESKSCASSNWLSSISTSGVPACTQPTFSDISGTIANAQTTGTALNTASTLVLRDGSGNFAAGTITATLTGNVTGNVTGSASLNVLKAGDTMTGALVLPAGSSGSPALSLNSTSGLYSPGANLLGFSTGGAYVGQSKYVSGSTNAKAQWFFGDNIFTNTQSSPLVLQSTNYQLTLKGSTDTNAKTWYFDVDAAGGGTFQINSSGSGETGFVSPSSTLYWGAGGTPPTRLAVVSNSSVTTSPTAGGNTRSYLAAKNTDSTANNHEGFNAYAANGMVGMASWVNEVQTAAAMNSHFELGVANAGVVTTRLKLLTTGQPVFSYFSSAGAVLTDSSGNLSSQALTNGQLLIGSTGSAPSAASLTAGSGITITPGAGSITIAASGTPAANLLTKTADYTLGATDNVILANCSTSCTMTLESAATGGSGTTHTIKRIGSATVNIATTSSQTIDGDTSTALTDPYVSLTVISDGSNWYAL